MQPDLPWNVAGIPPEAREAARAAARREGLSVGEWLTRRILRSLSAEPQTWARNGADDYRHNANDSYDAPARDFDAPPARQSRQDSETQNSYRRIEDQLQNLGRRIDAAEQTQTENGKVMSQAAAEISAATREQTQAFEKMGSHVMGLGDRLAHVERSEDNESVKNAMKGLHTGLTRLADQITETANVSAARIASLAGNVESLAGKLAEARNEADKASRDLALKVAAVDERTRATEARTHANSQRLERTIEGLESTRIGERVDRSENERQAQIITQLSETLDRLASRITSSEAQLAGGMARLEDKIATVEARKTEAPFDRRLQTIEHALTDIATRLDSAEYNTSHTNVEASVRELATRIDAAEKRHGDALADLRTTMAQQAQARTPEFDLPSFAESAPPPQQRMQTNTMEPAELPPAHSAEQAFAGDFPFASNPFGPSGGHTGEPADSYIAAARRSAREAATAEAHAPKASLGGFTWAATPPPAEKPGQKGGLTRALLMIAIALFAICTVAAGIFLSRGMIGVIPGSMEQTAPKPRAVVPLETPLTVRKDAQNDSGNIENTSGDTAVHATPEAAAPLAAPSRQTAAAPHVDAKPPVSAVTPAPAPPVTAAHQPPTASVLDRLTALASAGSAKAQLLVGLKYLDGDGTAVNEAEAAKWLERAANQGEAIAAYRLGTLYERGHGVPADTAKAMQWYTASAKLGNRKAMHNLAVAYAEGSGAPKDMNLAAQWFSKAAALGLADSQFNLAVLYERGMGVQQSLVDAYKWYAIAAAQGDSESKTRLDAVTTQLSEDQRAVAQKAVAEFHPLPLERDANVPPDPSAIQ